MAANKRATITAEHTVNGERNDLDRNLKIKAISLFPFSNGCSALCMCSWPFSFVVDVLNILHWGINENGIPGARGMRFNVSTKQNKVQTIFAMYQKSVVWAVHCIQTRISNWNSETNEETTK